MIRAHLCEAVYKRWLEEKDIRLRVIGMEHALIIDRPAQILPAKDFAWISRQYAENTAQTDPYIFADDDHLILGRDWVHRAVEVWNANPGYTMLTAASAVRGETSYEGALWQEGLQTDIACVGATMIHKKGVVPYDKFSGKASQQDVIVCDWMKANEKKFAIMKSVHYLHLGFGLSQVEPLLYGRY
jgi:hypothetical protein